MTETAGHVYADKYYDYIDRGSIRSADGVIPVVRRHVDVNSVLDVGCGRGAWLRQWAASGVSDFVGVDGDYVQVDKLPFSADHFVAADLTRPLDLGRRFDLVQCLEVAEHLPLSAADTLIDSLVHHGDAVLFSAAVPGQGGEFHVNEQPIAFWAEKFRQRGFDAWDIIRPPLLALSSVEPWYRYNTVLYVRSGALTFDRKQRFPAEGYREPKAWRIRNALIGLLPRFAVDRLARLKHAFVRTIHAGR